MKPTQYARILTFLTSVGNFGASYLELSTRCRTNCPWKRIGELESRGYEFRRWSVTDNNRQRTMVALVGVPK